MTTTVDIEETPKELVELLALASEGNEVIIAQGNRPVARLLPGQAPGRRIGNLNPGSITTYEDFDAPLPDDFWTGTGRESSWTLTSSSGGTAN
jgi:antitoxin (DNA-binding transcriptional repressor) of toxin-antitoxin stability system